MPETSSSLDTDTSDLGSPMPFAVKIGLPLAVFGAVLLLLSIGLSMLVSPDRFPVRVGDRVVRLSELEEEEASLRKEYADLLSERETLLKDADAPVLTQVRSLREDMRDIGPLLLAVDDARSSFRVGALDPIAIPDVTYEAQEGTLVLRGTVTDPGGRSVAILSRFVDALRNIDLRDEDLSVSDPDAYVQEDLADGGSVSHFSIRLHIRGH